MVRAPCRPKGSSREPRLGFLTSICFCPSPVWARRLLPASAMGLQQVGTIGDVLPLSLDWQLPPSGCAADAAFDFALEKMSSMDSDRPLAASFRVIKHTKKNCGPPHRLAGWPTSGGFATWVAKAFPFRLEPRLLSLLRHRSQNGPLMLHTNSLLELPSAAEKRWLWSFDCKGGWR